MNKEDFCVFILTHGRPDQVHTCKALEKGGYTGKVFIVIDDQDKTASKYHKNFKDQVVVFCKKDWASKTDSGDNFDDFRGAVYARNFCWDLAKRLGYKWFIVLEDDYTNFRYRVNHLGKYETSAYIKDLDSIWLSMMNFYSSAGLTSIAMGQGGDYIGGSEGGMWSHNRSRKCMNSFFCSTELPFTYAGKMNDDVNTFLLLGSRGKIFLTIYLVALEQLPTQATSGGMTEFYQKYGTYLKSLYSVMYNPSCVKIKPMSSVHKRLHHLINWERAVPKILREEWKK